MIFLHCYNVYSFPNIESKRNLAPISSASVLLSDLVFAEPKEFIVSVGIPNTTIRKQQCWFLHVSTACELNFKSNRVTLLILNLYNHWGKKPKESEPTANDQLKIFVICFRGEKLMPSFWCSWTVSYQTTSSTPHHIVIVQSDRTQDQVAC